MIQYKKKAYFTLLEMLVVMFIISLGVIVTGVKVQEAYFEQRFYSETQQVLGQLSMAQDFMLILDTDVQATLKTDPDTDQVVLSLNVEKSLSDAWARLVERKLTFPSIHSFKFKSEEDHNQEENPLILNFSFGAMSKGKLTLSEGRSGAQDKESVRQFVIELPGYPSPLGKAVEVDHTGRRKGQSDQLYPSEVYEKLYKNKENEIKTPNEAEFKKT